MSALPFDLEHDDDGTFPLVSRRTFAPLRDDDPTRLGRFVLTCRVPGGNPDTMKFLGWDSARRAYLLKVLRGADGVVQWRLAHEARVAIRVRSPRVARVLGYAEEGQFCYVVQRFVVGPTLRDVLHTAPGRRLTGRDLSRLAVGLAAALQDVADADLVHGDPTAANVVLARRRLVLVDLGASRALGEIRPEVYGTPFSIAPEQLDGHEIEPPTDVYIWGLTTAQAGTGYRPFDPGGRLTAEQYGVAQRNRQPVLDGLPPALRDVVAEALHPDPAARPTIHEVVRRLERDLVRDAGEPTHSLGAFTRRLTHELVDRSDTPVVPLTPTVRELVRYAYWRALLREYRRELVHRVGTQWRAVAVGAFVAFALAFVTALAVLIGPEWVVGR
jgi:serine/threonine protein kinase